MPRITVPVIKAFEYQGLPLDVGDTVSLLPVEAAVLGRRGVVSLTRVQTRDIKAEDASDTPDLDTPRPKRRYRRRDMTAEHS